ncbi:hypothetical protein Shyhy02_73390 [Streptomyces hygroscopicus subsp. hygroscopicus]|nr:hypothetical protein Shyhy02_73390 [Streptomyces hygroscopicus subsp. hygroscopicus]
MELKISPAKSERASLVIIAAVLMDIDVPPLWVVGSGKESCSLSCKVDRCRAPECGGSGARFVSRVALSLGGRRR